MKSATWDWGCNPNCSASCRSASFERLGGNTTVNVNIRLICATNQNLQEMVQQGEIPRGSFLPAECGSYAYPAAARASRRYRSSRAVVPRRRRPAIQQESEAVFTSSVACPRGICLAGKCPGTRKCRATRRWFCRKDKPWMSLICLWISAKTLMKRKRSAVPIRRVGVNSSYETRNPPIQAQAHSSYAPASLGGIK